MPLIADLLARRVASGGASPLVTHYDLDAGSRIELSATTLANWVAKTSNLMTDELMLDAGDPVELLVASSDPGHWMTLVWALACWRTGAVVTLGRADEARVVVTGPSYDGVEPGDAELVACSLHPLGLGLPAPVPGHVVDYATEVRGQGDVYAGVALAPHAPAWLDAGRQLTQSGLLQGEVPAGPRRVLVRPGEPWTTVRDAVVVPLRDGGSSVVVSGTAAEGRLDEIGRAERVDGRAQARPVSPRR